MSENIFRIEGVITHALPPRSGKSRDGNDYTCAEYVIEEQGLRWPRSLVFAVFGSERIGQMALREGEYVRVSFDTRARQGGDGRFHNTVRAYKAERVAPPPAPPQMTYYAPGAMPLPPQQGGQQWVRGSQVPPPDGGERRLYGQG